ncbi:MAG: hypothetical protein AB7V36_07585 [Bacteroidales bacterium]
MLRKVLTAFLLIVSMCSPVLSQTGYALKEKDAYASCVDFIIVDDSGKTVDVPAVVSRALQCPSLLSLHGDTLCYRSGNSIRMYHISSGADYQLFDVFDDVDGVSGPVWSPSHHRIGFVIINQLRSHGYKDMCRIIILDLDADFKVKYMHRYDRPVNFSCGSICSSNPGSDFRFADENNFEYIRNINIEDSPGEKGYIFIGN